MVSKNEVALEIEKLLFLAEKMDLLGKYDSIPARNKLLKKLNLNAPYSGEINNTDENKDWVQPDSLQDILNSILDYAWEQEIIKKNTITRRDLFDTEIMGILMPRQSEVTEKFWETAENKSIKKATDNFYQLAQNSNYIRKERIDRNEYWKASTDFGDLEITINLAKPEKDPDEIAEAGKQDKTEYPKCPLCLENVGYPGRLDHPARHNLRVIPLELKGEDWFLQYSPYVYYQEHCIVLSRKHRPMQINKDTFQALFNFLELIPHYFIGSNADLPLVGGSILSHDHFQGGNHVFPMEKAKIQEDFKHPNFPDIQVGIVNWPLSVIRLNGGNKQDLIELAEQIRLTWETYDDIERNIKSYSKIEGRKEKHNTITPIARLRDGNYELDIVLRNNRRSQEHPTGIFHPHQELHHIKKENIGLIEVMGLAVLPGRLKKELQEIKSFLTGDKNFNDNQEVFSDNNDLELKKHIDWIKEMLANYGQNNSITKADEILKQEVANKFAQVLCDAGVFKLNSHGIKGFVKFLMGLGFDKT